MAADEKMDSTKSDKAFGSGGASARATLIVCTLLYILNYMDRQVLAAVLQPMKIALGLTDTEAGWFATVFSAGAAVFAWPMGMLVDRWSRKKSVGLMALFWSAATFATGMGKSFMAILIPRALVGVGEAGYGAGSTALITASFPAKVRSRVQSIWLLGIPVGTILGLVLGGILSAKFGWQTPFYIFAIPGIILGIIAFFLKDYKNVKATDAAPRMGFLRTTGHLFKVPTLLWIYLGIGPINMLSLAFLTWTPAFMMRALNIREDKAGMLFAVIALAALLGTVLGGFLSDKWYRKNVRSRLYIGTIACVLSIVTYVPGILLIGAGQMIPALVILFFFGISIVVFYPSIQVATQEVVHPAMKGMAFGLYAVAVWLLGAPGPVLVGKISDILGGGVIGLRNALLSLTLLIPLSILFFWLGSRTYTVDSEKVKNIKLESEK